MFQIKKVPKTWDPTQLLINTAKTDTKLQTGIYQKALHISSHLLGYEEIMVLWFSKISV